MGTVIGQMIRPDPEISIHIRLRFLFRIFHKSSDAGTLFQQIPAAEFIQHAPDCRAADR